MSILKKFSFAYVKKHPVMFGGIVVVFGLLFWLLLNRGSSGSSGTAGPTDAEVAANAQLKLAQIGSSTQMGLAQLQLAAASQSIAGQKEIAAMEIQYRLAELATTSQLGMKQLEASLAALAIQTNASISMNNSNNQFAYNYAKLAHDTALMTTSINAALHRDLAAMQLEGYKFGLVVGQIGNLKEGARDETLERIWGSSLTGTATYPSMTQEQTPSGGGGFNPINVVVPISNLF